MSSTLRPDQMTMSKPTLLTRVDAEHKTAMVYAHNGQTWAFISHAFDPALDYVVKPDGRVAEIYFPGMDEEQPPGIPSDLWVQFVVDCTEGWYGTQDRSE